MRLTLGMAMLWGAYAVGFYGYCLLEGFALSFPQVVNPRQRWVSPKGLTSAADGALPFPPGYATGTQVIPPHSGTPIKVGSDGSVG